MLQEKIKQQRMINETMLAINEENIDGQQRIGT